MRRKTEKKMIVVIGASRLGAQIASMSSEDGIYTAIVDSDASSFNKVSGNYSGDKILGDAQETSVLEKAHIREAKEAVVATGDDDTNIFIACLITTLYSVPNVIVRLRDERKAALLSDPRIQVISTSMLSLNAYKAIKATEE